ncbi:hypothetical protein DFH09DRAFT_1105859 [Mycena vulgaris]|nr:hypothetical protein DFH09DRAFT_1105859 [Mycena vulgaris]
MRENYEIRTQSSRTQVVRSLRGGDSTPRVLYYYELTCHCSVYFCLQQIMSYYRGRDGTPLPPQPRLSPQQTLPLFPARNSSRGSHYLGRDGTPLSPPQSGLTTGASAITPQAPEGEAFHRCAGLPCITERGSVASFKHKSVSRPYMRYQGVLPAPATHNDDGALARITASDWRMYSARSGTWISVGENSRHPTLEDVRVGPDCRWVNRRTITEHKGKRRREDYPGDKSFRLPATRLRKESPIPSDELDQSSGPGVGVLPQNAFLLELAKRWRDPPLSFYTTVSAKALAILDHLSHSPTAVVLHQFFPVPSHARAPHGSFVIDDLVAMGEDLINYHDLCAEGNTPLEPVSAVITMLFKSYLMEPWRPGQRIVSLSNIAATDKGMLRCRLDWHGLVQQLGDGFAFGDYDWMYTAEELGKMFPSTSANAAKKRGKLDAKRSAYLEGRGKEPWVASVRTPPGWFSDMHVDMAGLAQAMIHFEGEKLWLFWPATPKNLRWWGLQHPHPWTGHASRIVEALDALEGLEVLHVTEPCAFVLPPFCIHAVIAFQGSSHACVTFAHSTHWDLARGGLEFCKTLIRNPEYPATSVITLVDQVVHETPLWERAMGMDSIAATYLAAWKEDTAQIYDEYRRRGTSSA